jgi:hypothetical protein
LVQDQELEDDLLDVRALPDKPLMRKSEEDKNFAQAVAEQNHLLQERVIALETMIKEKVDVSDVAMVKRMHDVEEKLAALGESVEQIKSALVFWTSALQGLK